MSEQEYMDFRSKYLDITVGVVNKEEAEQGRLSESEVQYEGRQLEDIDFCLELLHSDIINVAYILALIKDLNPESENYEAKRQHILDTMIRDAAMRNKTKLIDGFIKQNVDNDKPGFIKAKDDGTIDLESRLNDYISKAKSRAIEDLASEEGLEEESLQNFIEQYDYLQREKTEILEDAIMKKKVGLKERRNILKRVLGKLRTIIDTFSWD